MRLHGLVYCAKKDVDGIIVFLLKIFYVSISIYSVLCLVLAFDFGDTRNAEYSIHENLLICTVS